MDEVLMNQKKEKLFSVLEICIIILLALVPLFMTFPYRVNIFLSWEGAYRMSEGQIPFRDFGMPLGYMYWVIPAIFFKIFGPQLITLVKAQVLINILSGLAFRSILKNLSVQSGVRLLSVLLYCVSFSFFNFWPWYNHTTIVYELIGLAFLMRYFFTEGKKWILLSLSALFVFFSFFTKQDAGGLACVLCLVLLLYYCFSQKKWAPLFIFLISLIVVTFAVIAPLTKFNFGYWFNHGQPPHTSRISVFEIIDEFLYSSQWIKFYLVLILLIFLRKNRNFKQVAGDTKNTLFMLLTVGILAEAAVLQVTSYTPPDNNIFFHSFAFVFIVSNLTYYLGISLSRLKPLIVVGAAVIIWWSGIFWKYVRGTAYNFLSKIEVESSTKENIVNRSTYLLHPPTGEIPMSDWTFSGLKAFHKVYMPRPTVEGINRLLNLAVVKNESQLKVLNMTELTPLAVEMPFKVETGPDIPLWYHLGVSMFNKQAGAYERKIADHAYDLVLFEYVPSLNNFYPFRVRDTLLNYYKKIDSFPAPRRGDTQGVIEVFAKF
jgi:hypothetical protein